MTISLLSTGISGLDEILGNGLPRYHTYLVAGGPGTGKTTMGLQFLLEGVRQGEKVLYITLLQSEGDVRELAESHGWDLDGVDIRVFLTEAERESRMLEQSLLPSSEIQLKDIITVIRQVITTEKPDRLVFDSVEQLRLLAGDQIIYRQKILAIQQLLNRHNVTAYFVEATADTPEFQTLGHGVFVLETVVRHFGEMKRRILIEKMRCRSYLGGYHDFRIKTGGVVVYPPLPSARKTDRPPRREIKSGNAEIDQLLGGGLPTGTTCLVAGHTGTGKTSLATMYVNEASKRDEKSAVFLFDECRDTFLERAQSLGMDLYPALERGQITIDEVNIGEISAGELSYSLREKVEADDIDIILFDSLTGFYQTLPDEPLLLVQLHEMLAYLGRHQVLTFLVVTEHGMFGDKTSNIDASFIADSVILLRRFEAAGNVRLAVGVMKKRHGHHEKFIREMLITPKGIKTGPPLKSFRGILSGFPTYTGDLSELMD